MRASPSHLRDEEPAERVADRTLDPRRQLFSRLAAQGQRRAKRVAPGPAPIASPEMLLELGADIPADLALETLGEELHDVWTCLLDRSGRRRLAGAERGRDHLAHRDAGAMEPALHRRDRERQDVRDLRCREPLDVTQDEHLPVHRVEPADRVLQGRPHLLARCELLGPALCVGDVVSLARDIVERLDVDRGELARAVVLQAEAARDGVEPGRDRRRAPEIGDPARRGDERLLEHVLRILDGAAHLHPEPKDAVLMALEQPLDRGLVTGARRGQQLFIRARHAADPYREPQSVTTVARPTRRFHDASIGPRTAPPRRGSQGGSGARPSRFAGIASGGATPCASFRDRYGPRGPGPRRHDARGWVRLSAAPRCRTPRRTVDTLDTPRANGAQSLENVLLRLRLDSR